MLQGAAIGAGGFHETEVAARDVNPAIDAHFQPVGGVVGGTIFEAEGDVRNEALGFLGDAIAIAIKEDGDVRWVKEVETVVIPNEAAGRIDVADEFGDLIGAAIFVIVAKSEDTTPAWIATEGAIAIG